MIMTDMTVSNEILRQLGGNKFRVMTGAKDFVGGERTLQFKLPSTPNFVNDGINFVVITLEATDYYSIQFYRLWGRNLKEISRADPVSVETLRESFTLHTGLDTSL